jgi:hypothetical protein
VVLDAARRHLHRLSHLGHLGHAGHLARRFAGSLWPGGPRPADEAWALGWLGVGERALWARMSGPDRRHAVGVARRVVAALGPARAERPVVAAALLHDAGKVDSGLGTFARVVATVFVRQGANGDGRLARYRRHDAIGAALLAAAGAPTPWPSPGPASTTFRRTAGRCRPTSPGS